MMKASRWRVLAIALLVLVLFSQLAVGQKKYEGVTITVSTIEGVISEPWRVYAQRWAQQTGAKVNVVAFAFNNYYEGVMTDLITGGSTYDVIDHPGFWIGDLVPFGIPVDSYIKAQGIGEDDYFPVFKTLFQWGAQRYSVVFDGDVWSVAYRKDLFDNPTEKANFKAKYGYELKAPWTWDQYYDVAQFFTRKAGTMIGGEKLKFDFGGNAELQKRGGGMGSVWSFLSHYATYLNTPMGIRSGDMYFDPDTMKPRINCPAGVKAIEDLIKAASPTRSVKGALEVDWSLMADLFTSGKVAMCMAWGDLGPFAQDPKRSVIINKAGYTTIPASKTVWDIKQQKWMDWKEDNGIHNAAMLAWCKGMVITKTCKNPDAAFDLVRFMVMGDDQLVEEATDPASGINPYKTQQTDSPKVLAAFSGIPTYIPAYKQCLLSGVPDLRIPQTVAYYDSLELWVDKAKLGELTPKEALARCDADWEKITDSAGRIKQKLYYRQSLGMTR